tara:strand:- start:114 stop:569 length:456 start_codon:yes stop_codon:yes gene_type:complete
VENGLIKMSWQDILKFFNIHNQVTRFLNQVGFETKLMTVKQIKKDGVSVGTLVVERPLEFELIRSEHVPYEGGSPYEGGPQTYYLEEGEIFINDVLIGYYSKERGDISVNSNKELSDKEMLAAFKYLINNISRSALEEFKEELPTFYQRLK